MAVNAYGHQQLTALLLPALARGAKGRVVNVASLASLPPGLDVTDLAWERRAYSATGAYYASKRANVLFTNEFNRRYHAATGVVAVASQPGFTATSLLPRASGLGFWFPGRAKVVALFNRCLGMPVAVGALSQLRAAVEPDVVPNSWFGPCLCLWGMPKLWHAGPPVWEMDWPIFSVLPAATAAEAAALWDAANDATGAEWPAL